MKVAFVVQRCGREVNGGAELHCLQVAQRMASYWSTEVLTTCQYLTRMSCANAASTNRWYYPSTVDPARWNVPPDPDLTEQLPDGRTNILFVGRIAPNKKQDDLVRAFQASLVTNPSSRLILVGSAEQGDPYAAHLRGIIESNGLAESVTIAGSIHDSQLAAYYWTAHLFWSMSEHEGFCVPLIEAMWFDIPVLAYRSTAVSETLGDAALMFTDKGDLHAVAAIASLLITDRTLRQRLIDAQRKRRAQFLPEQIRPFVFHLLGRLSPSNVAQPDRQRR